MVTFSGVGSDMHQGFFQSNTDIWRGAAMVVVWLLIINCFALIAFNRLNLAPGNDFDWMANGVIKQPARNWCIAGLFLCVLLLVEFIHSQGWKSLFGKRVLPLVLAPSGAFGFFLYHWIAFGDFFLYLRIQFNWGRDFDMAATDYLMRNSPYMVNMVNDLLFTSMVIVIGLLAMKQLRISYGIYMLVSVLLLALNIIGFLNHYWVG